MREGWRLLPLTDLTKRVRRAPAIDSQAEYKQITIGLYGKGARLRKIILGNELGSSKYEVKTGDLLLSKINARRGASSVIPNYLDGSIVSSDYIALEIDCSVAEIAFIDLAVRRPEFAALAEIISTGTGQKRVDPSRLDALIVPIPPRRNSEESSTSSEPSTATSKPSNNKRRQSVFLGNLCWQIS